MGLFDVVVNLHAIPVGLVAGDEVLVEGVLLVDVVAFGVVEDDGEADGVGVIDDFAGSWRGHRPEVAH